MAPSLEVLQDENVILSISEKSDIAQPFRATLEKNAQSAPDAARKLVGEALVAEVNKIDHDVCDAGDEDSFFVADLGEVYRSYQMWMERIPQVHPHYAVKCNTDVEVVKLLGSLGVNFDCASKTEIDTVLGLGFDALRIVYANPCKTNSFIRHARDLKVNLTTVDNAQELYKMKKFHPKCGILVRIATDDSTAQCRLSTKFGCTISTAVGEILPLCKELELNVVGVAFHVGSGAKDFDSIHRAVKEARYVFDEAYKLGLPMSILDIGGGFERETFEESSEMVNRSLSTFFPPTYTEQHGIRFIAEPGRFMVANAFTLATHIIARRDLNVEGMEAMVYINDGVYGNLNCILFDHQHPTAKVLKHDGKVYFKDNTEAAVDEPRHQYVFSIWGPTCDGLDCVSTKMVLDANVQVGDWLYFSNLGAYTSAASTSFNGFSALANVKYVTSVDFK